VDIESIKRLLWNEWDPCGVNGNDMLRDEYDSYAPQVFRLAREGASVDMIAACLDKIAVERMGLPANPARSYAVAAKALALFRPPS
jgi:hypothetical protein